MGFSFICPLLLLVFFSFVRKPLSQDTFQFQWHSYTFYLYFIFTFFYTFNLFSNNNYKWHHRFNLKTATPEKNQYEWRERLDRDAKKICMQIYIRTCVCVCVWCHSHTNIIRNPEYPRRYKLFRLNNFYLNMANKEKKNSSPDQNTM